LSADVAQDVQAKPAWKHQVENEQIVIKAQCLAFDLCSVVDNVGRVTFFLQSLLYKTRNFPVVFRDQDPHDTPPGYRAINKPDGT
jgi:hypothetical protein